MVTLYMKKSNGVSLFEALVCIFILSIMIGLSSATFLNVSPKYKLKNAVWEIHSRLNYARYRAVFDGEKVRMRFESPFYVIEKFDTDQKVWTQTLQNFLEGVTVAANNSPIFHPSGTVSNLASIDVSNSWGKYRITIAITGRIKVTQI